MDLVIGRDAEWVVMARHEVGQWWEWVVGGTRWSGQQGPWQSCQDPPQSSPCAPLDSGFESHPEHQLVCHFVFPSLDLIYKTGIMTPVPGVHR